MAKPPSKSSVSNRVGLVILAVFAAIGALWVANTLTEGHPSERPTITVDSVPDIGG